MNTENLKLILETINGAKDGAIWVAVAWLARDLLIGILGYGVGGYAIYRVSELIKYVISSCRFESKLMDAIGTSVYLDRDEQRMILELIRKGQAAPRQKEQP